MTTIDFGHYKHFVYSNTPRHGILFLNPKDKYISKSLIYKNVGNPIYTKYLINI